MSFFIILHIVFWDYLLLNLFLELTDSERLTAHQVHRICLSLPSGLQTGLPCSPAVFLHVEDSKSGPHVFMKVLYPLSNSSSPSAYFLTGHFNSAVMAFAIPSAYLLISCLSTRGRWSNQLSILFLQHTLMSKCPTHKIKEYGFGGYFSFLELAAFTSCNVLCVYMCRGHVCMCMYRSKGTLRYCCSSGSFHLVWDKFSHWSGTHEVGLI